MGVHTDHDLDAFGDWERQQWEKRAASYAAALGDLTRGSAGALLDAAGVRSGSRVLDVGAGPGFVALAAMARGAVVIGADQSAEMVRLARAAGVDAVVAPVERLPFDDDSYDAVVAGYLLHHLPRPEAAVASLGRVLRIGGRLAMTVWDGPAANPVLGLFHPVVAELGLQAVVPPGPDAQRFADPDELHRLLAGWVDVTVERVTWPVRVDPGAWFDAVAASMPRTGAVLAQASPEQRAQARERYVEVARAAYGSGGGAVELPAGAVLGAATKQ